jgi:hypothetical protein
MLWLCCPGLEGAAGRVFLVWLIVVVQGVALPLHDPCAGITGVAQLAFQLAETYGVLDCFELQSTAVAF